MSSASLKWESGCPSVQPPLCGHPIRRGELQKFIPDMGSISNICLRLLQVGSRGIEASWAGGRRGREVTDRFLSAVPQLLSTEGVFYLITIAENDPGEFTYVLDNT